MPDLRLSTGTVLFVVLAIFAPAAHAAAPFQPGAHGFGHQKVCKSVPAHFARCHAEVVVDVGGEPLVTPAPDGYGPSDLLSAYGLTSQAASAGGSQTIAIVDAYDHPNAEADLGVYRSQFGLSPCTTANGCFRKVDQRGGTAYPKANGGWAQEISLDLDMASAICPNCKILLVEADSNSFANLVAAVDRAAILGATQISNSYGGNEYPSETSDESHYNHPDIAVTVSSGDSGYGAEFPASSRYVTAVGGTNLQPNAGSARGWSETAWSGAGSGCSAYVTKPAWQTDSGCARRTVADVSAVADPNSGVAVYDSFAFQGASGWMVFGGTSAAAPIVAGFYALVGLAAATPSFAYNNPSSFNDVTSGSNGSCGGSYLCTAKAGYDGPTGVGTPQGGAAPAKPKPTVTTQAAGSVVATTATLNGSVNPNGSSTTYHFDYGTTTSYGSQSPAVDASAGSGSSAVAESTSLSGLAPNTTYHFRLVATNEGGTSTGSDLSFTTGDKPSVTTAAASSVLDTTATLNGSVTPNRLSTTYHFEYGTTTSYGSTTSDTSAGSGTSGVAASANLSGLAPSTTYHFRLVATNAGGTTSGSDLTLTTGDKPSVTTQAASSITTSGATLNGSVNPNRLSTTYHFEYGTTTSYGSSSATTGAGSGSSAVAVSATLGGLSPGTTYHFRLVATNAAGTTLGGDQMFTTLMKPSVTTGAASAVIDTTATLNGSVNPNGSSTTYHFEYGTTTSYGSQSPSVDASVGSGSSGVAVSTSLTGLVPNTTYHFRLVATNAAGTTTGSDLTLTTADKPSVTTQAATSVLDSTATLNGSVNPSRLSTTYHFEYGTTTAYGSQSPAVEASAGSGSSNVAVSTDLIALTPSTTYHFRLVATNGAGTTTGSDLTLTTGDKPSVTTQAASLVTTSSATLNGSVNPNRLSTTYHFEYGTTTSYGSSSATTGAGSGSSAVAVSATLGGLSPGATYHFRLVATNAAGTTLGGDQMFATIMKPSVTTGAASAVIDTTATLAGSVDPNGSSTTYRFEYGTSVSYGSQSPAVDADAGSGSSSVPVSTNLNGLTPSTTYHFRVVATNAAGTTTGTDQTFTTGDKPAATTQAASSITESGATLHAAVNPNRLDTTYRFEFGTTTAYGSQSPVVDVGSGWSDEAASSDLSALDPDTTYHFRVVATNAAGTTFGDDQTLTTASPAGGTTTTTTTDATPPPPDTNTSPGPTAPLQTAPSLCAPKLSVPKQRRRSIRRHGLRATIRCAPAGSIVASLVLHRRGHKPLVLKRVRRVRVAPGTTKLVLRLSRRMPRALTLKVVITDAAGTRIALKRKLSKIAT